MEFTTREIALILEALDVQQEAFADDLRHGIVPPDDVPGLQRELTEIEALIERLKKGE